MAVSKTLQDVIYASSVSKTIEITAHAEYRKAQRNISNQDIGYVLLYGTYFHKAGAIIIHLRDKDIPDTDRVNPRCQKLIGISVVMTKKGRHRVLTVYRNRRNGLRHIKRKLNYGRS